MKHSPGAFPRVNARLAPGLLLLPLLLSGCVESVYAPLPEDGEPFAALAWGCGLQAYAHADLVLVRADRYAYRLTLETPHEGLAPANLSLDEGVADAVVEDARRMGVLERLGFGEGKPYAILRAERDQLGSLGFASMRVAVAQGDLAHREKLYSDQGIEDGCSYLVGAWDEGAYHAVESVDGSGPFGLDRLRNALLGTFE